MGFATLFINLLKITVDFFSFFSQPSKKACFFFGHLGCVFSLRPGCHYEIPRCQNELLPPEQEWMAWNMCSTLSLNPKLMVLLRWCSFFFIYLTTDIHLIVHDLSVICPSTVVSQCLKSTFFGSFATHWDKNQFLIQKLPRIWCLKMWILWKVRLWKCEFCEKWDLENVNYVKNENLKLWILSKMRFWKCEFCEKWHF